MELECQSKGGFKPNGRLLADTVHLSDLSYVSLIHALDVSPETGQQALSDFNLLRPADYCSQQFSQAARGGIRGDPIGRLVSQGERFQFMD
jgi:hypothetical protein